MSWCQAEGMVHKMMSRSIWCHVFHKRCNINPACVSQRIERYVTFLSHSTLKLCSPEFRWCVICVGPVLIILLNTSWVMPYNVPLSRTVTFYSPIAGSINRWKEKKNVWKIQLLTKVRSSAHSPYHEILNWRMTNQT